MQAGVAKELISTSADRGKGKRCMLFYFYFYRDHLRVTASDYKSEDDA